MADLAENQMGVRTRYLMDQLDNPPDRAASLNELRKLLTRIATEAHAPEDSEIRQRARRILNDTISYNNARPGGRQDAEYMKLLDAVKP
jgi:hypothetical protein